MKNCLLLLALAATACLSEAKRYDNHRIIRLKPTRQVDAIISELHLDRWARGPGYTDVRVSPQQYRQLDKQGVLKKGFKVLESNVQALIDRQRLANKDREAGPEDKATEEGYFNSYHRVAEMYQWTVALKDKYPNLVTLFPSIGKSVEGRDIWAVKLTGTGGDATSKKRVWIQGLLHAREWISGITVQYVANALAEAYADKKDEAVVKLLDQVEFVMVPVTNPDGYDYTWTTDRLWRKNRGMVNGTVVGIDLNRNYPDHWGVGLASNDTKDETYIGPAPLSEPEVRALTDFYATVPNIIGALDFHSYSQLLLRPYGWTESPLPLAMELKFAKISEVMKDGIKLVNKTTEYVPIRAVDLYLASGAADDWFNGLAVKDGEQRPYGMTIELSPASYWEGGFILPPQRIAGVGEEMTEAVKRYAQFALENPLGVRKPAKKEASQ